jgi:hypothetical protein
MFISNDDFIALSGSWNVTKCKEGRFEIKLRKKIKMG